DAITLPSGRGGRLCGPFTGSYEGAREVLIELRDRALEMRERAAGRLARAHRLGELGCRAGVFLVDFRDHLASLTADLGIERGDVPPHQIAAENLGSLRPIGTKR